MLKRFICLKNVIILSICISWDNFFMLSTWKQLFLACAKSPHSKRKWRTVNGTSQPTHCGCSSPCSKYEWVTLVWPKRSRARPTSSFLMFRTTDWWHSFPPCKALVFLLLAEYHLKHILKDLTIRNSYQFPNVPSHKWQNWKVDNGSSILSGLVVKLNNSKWLKYCVMILL